MNEITASDTVKKARYRPAFQTPQLRLVRRPSLAKTLLVVLLLCLWEGLPFSLFGGNPLIAFQTYAVIAVAGIGIYLVGVFTNRVKSQWWEWVAALLFAWCLFVSFYYSTWQLPQPVIQWLPSAYTVTPVLTIFLLKGVNCELEDVVRAILWTGFVASCVVIVDVSLGTGLLDYYSRGSAFSDGRVVFLKATSGFALIIAFTRLAQSPPQMFIPNLLIMLPIAYNIFVLTESRIFILAIFLAIGLLWLLVLRGTHKVFLAALAPFTAIPLLIFVADRYFSNFRGLDQYMAQDVSSKWRAITIEHFSEHFDRFTDGLGFGFMSANPIYKNFLSFSTNDAGALHGVAGYAVALDDIGLYSALFQFGYVGLILIIVMTFVCIFKLGRAHRILRRLAPVSAMGFLMATLMISPISMNWFTLFYTAHLGGMLWFMASRVDQIMRSPSFVPVESTPAEG
ncbi:hypothetical protein GRI97_12370 [Altererythrobacter xixiisoli]|uniref:Uncharacterized protein n=1 Tax=Croceibacterium xixiisoli TaxID=1476466 RepID=A0A6I4TUZ6_9SPHN|nr:hypothetical protein [Croceibacterium xixiisoli]MXO99784.1 hypothetical protein [Croceibacterium xixiisoli]